MKARETKAKSGWLVTWTGTGGLPQERVAAILNYRRSASSVREFVEQLYVALKYGNESKLLYAKNPKAVALQSHTTLFQSIMVGDNPWLHARQVTDLKYVDDKLVWTEPEPELQRLQRLKDAGIIR